MKIENTLTNISSIALAVALGLAAISANAAMQQNQDIYAPQLFTGGGYGQSNNSYAGGGAWVPLYQNPTNVVFTQFTMPEYRKQTGFYESIDFGLRHLVPDRSLWGVYGGFSSIQGQTSNYSFYRATGGLTLQLPHWIFNFTAYVPFGDSDFDKGLNDTSEQLVADPDNSNFKNILVNQEADPIRILPGGIAELGWRVPHSRGLTVYGGYYEYLGQGGFGNYYGPEVRLQYHLDTLLGWHPGWLHHVNLDAGWSDDNANQSIYTVGISIDMPVFGDSSYHNLSALQQAMEAPVYSPAVDRGIHDNKSFRQTFDMTDGQRTTVQEVDTKAELQSATSSNSHANWVLLTGDVDMGTDTLTLANGVNLTGNGITLDNGQTFLANGSGNNKTISGSWSGGFGPTSVAGVAIRIADDGSNRIQYLSIERSSDSNYNAISNSYDGSTGQGVGTVNINHVTTNGEVLFNIADGSTGSNISFDNNDLDLDSTFTGGGAIAGAFGIQLSGSSTATLDSATDNTIDTAGAIGYGFALSNSAGTLNVRGDIDGNTITTTGGIANGLDIRASGTGTDNITGDIRNNTISTTGTSATAMFMQAQGSNASITMSGGIASNNLTATSGNALNLYANGGTVTMSGGITSNTLNTTGTGSSGTGSALFLRAGSSGALTLSAITSNNITNTGSAGGVYVSADSASVTFNGGFTSNTITSTTGNAFNNFTDNSASISYESGLSGNTFVWDASGPPTHFGISNFTGTGSTICASNSTTITSDNTFSPTAGSGNQLSGSFTAC